MGLLSSTTCYLCGPVEAAQDAAGWRNDIGAKLARMRVLCYDPLKKPKWVGQKGLLPQADITNGILGRGPIPVQDAIDAQVLSRTVCLRLVSAADWVICRMPKTFTVGTIEELHIAYQRGCPTFFICPDGIPSAWLISMFAPSAKDIPDVFHETSDSLFEYLNKIDTGVDLDPLRWIFLAWTGGKYDTQTRT
jgi:hypothetical protein